VKRSLPSFARRSAWFGALVAVAWAGASGPAPAQDRDLTPLFDRIDRLERDVNMLQRQVYRGPPPGGTPMATSPGDANSALGTEMRVNQLADQLRTVTGQIEEINYNIDQLKRRLDTLSSDVDQRLSALEHGGRPLAAAAPATGTAAATVASKGAGGNPNEPASKSGILGTLPAGESGTTPTSAPPPPPPQASNVGPASAKAGTLPNGTPQDQYNYAFGLLRRADYPAAEQALHSFVQKYPNDALAGNAQYWLGETYFVRKDYNNAAAAFALGYQKYPKSGKAADNLLKLGMTLASLNKKSEACSAFARLDRDFPTAPPTVKERATSEKQHLGC
jgi:tol-pal system protein YbgF